MSSANIFGAALIAGSAAIAALAAAPGAMAEGHAEHKHAEHKHAEHKSGTVSKSARAEVAVGDLHITGAWIREAPPTAKTAAGYLIVTNKGADEDRLIAVHVGLSERAELHEMKMEGHMMTMREVEGGIVIPAKGVVTLEPGGLHLMFLGVKKPLRAGDKHTVTLLFKKAGEVVFDVPVERLAMKPGGHMKGHMKGHKAKSE
ncbi:MAG: copper chaperone PCu(A)C [Neomegalonema sp.]|nr:copper chaperone PCu(A)C [Neomegalonema sp.]